MISMTTSLTSRLDRLERQRMPEKICSICRGQGRWVTIYNDKNNAESDIVGCPECGRVNLITVTYTDVPLPASTGNDLPAVVSNAVGGW